MTLTRRRFFSNALALGASPAVEATATTQLEPEGFFTLGERDSHWWLITPGGEPFFTFGLNHIDPATMRPTPS